MRLSSLCVAASQRFSSFVSSAFLLALVAAAAIVLPASPRPAQAQVGEGDDLAEMVARAGEQYVRGYATGLVETSSAALGSGLFFESGQERDLLGPVNVYIGLRSAAVPVGGKERLFSLRHESSGQVRLNDGTLREVAYRYRVASAPTALGEHAPGPEVTVTARYRDARGAPTTEEFTFDAPQGLLGPLSFLPSAVPQVGIGVPALGLRLSARFTPTIAYEDKGEGALYGFGLRHALSAWTDALPFDVSVYGYYQHVDLIEGRTGQDFLDFDLFSGGVNVSEPLVGRSLYALSVFAGFGAETSTARFTYEAAQAGAPFSSVIDFSIRNTIRLRGRAGFSARLGPLLLNAGYAPLPRSTFSGGVGLAL